MSSTTIPKEQQSAYERWEMASFGDDRPGSKMTARSAAQSAVMKLANEMVEQLREEAQLAGFEAGRKAGLEAGRAEAVNELQQLHRIAESFGAEVAQADETIAQDVLKLALDLAQAMLKTALEIRPELVLPIVGEAIRYVPSLQQPALLYLNPLDAGIVRDHLGDELAKAGWRVAEDSQIVRGGCRVETASNQVDATVATRWQRLAEALGQESGWLTNLPDK